MPPSTVTDLLPPALIGAVALLTLGMSESHTTWLIGVALLVVSIATGLAASHLLDRLRPRNRGSGREVR